MALDNPTYIHQLNPTFPSAVDPVSQGDDQIRGVKRAILNTFKNIKGVVEVGHEFLNSIPDLMASVGDLKPVAPGFTPNAKYWALCDGRTVALSDASANVTLPDLRGVVLLGAQEGTYAAGQRYGTRTRSINTGVAGAHGHTATINAAGEHTHDFNGNTSRSTTGVTATLNTRRQDNDPGGGATNIESVTINDPGHTHGVSGSTTGSGSHTHNASISNADGHQHSVEFDVMQPSYAINWYMRI